MLKYHFVCHLWRQVELEKGSKKTGQASLSAVLVEHSFYAERLLLRFFSPIHVFALVSLTNTALSFQTALAAAFASLRTSPLEELELRW